MATSRLSTRRVEWRVQVGTSNKPGQGLVIFEASVSYIPDPLAAGGPRTAIPEPIAAVLDSGGYACTPAAGDASAPGERGVALFTTDSLGEDGGDWTWTARPQLRSVNGVQMANAVPAFSFAVPAGTGSLDLAEVQKVPASPGLGTERALALVLRAEKAAQDALNVMGDSVDEAAAAAVGKEIETQDLVVGTDPRMPTVQSTPKHLVVFLDADRRETWLGADASDGGPTPWATTMMQKRLGIGPEEAAGYLFALTDANRNLTDLAIRSTDGQFADFVIERLKKRILSGTGNGTSEALYLDGAFGSTAGDVVIPLPNMAAASGWGSSSLNLWSSKFATLFADYGSSYYNGAAPGEQIEHACARLGSHPARLAFPGDTIPTFGPVTVTASNMPASVSLKAFTGRISGVEGTLTSTGTTLTFTRTTAGSAVSSPAGEPFMPTIGPLHQSDVIIWGAGKNNLTGTAGRDTVVNKMTDEAIAWLTPKVKRVLVLGEFVNRGSTAAAKAQILSVNAYRAARYGNVFVDVQNYITGSQVWADSGITPTSNDLAQQAKGEKPDSLSLDDAHLNPVAQAAVFARFADRLNHINWY